MPSAPRSAPSDESELARQIEGLQRTVDGLVMRVMVCEAIFGFIAAGAIRAAPQSVQQALVADLRKVSATATSGADPSRRAELVLEAEERAAQLVDQIERFAKQPRQR
jgi:hypothetical protein